MKPAGTMIAYGRKWSLYERMARSHYGWVVKLFLSPKDQVELKRLDRQMVRNKLRKRYKALPKWDF